MATATLEGAQLVQDSAARIRDHSESIALAALDDMLSDIRLGALVRRIVAPLPVPETSDRPANVVDLMGWLSAKAASLAPR